MTPGNLGVLSSLPAFQLRQKYSEPLCQDNELAFFKAWHFPLSVGLYRSKLRRGCGSQATDAGAPGYRTRSSQPVLCGRRGDCRIRAGRPISYFTLRHRRSVKMLSRARPHGHQPHFLNMSLHRFAIDDLPFACHLLVNAPRPVERPGRIDFVTKVKAIRHLIATSLGEGSVGW